MGFPKGHKLDELTPKQVRFVQNYADINSPTFGNAVKSYEQSGYKLTLSAQQNASRLLCNDKIIKELDKYSPKTPQEYCKRLEITGAYADQATLQTYERAVSAGDITNQVACCRILQQRCGQLSDRLVVDVEDSRRLDDSHRLQAKRIAALITSGRMLLPASFEPVTSPIDVQDMVCSDNAHNNTSDVMVDNDTQVIDNQ